MVEGVGVSSEGKRELGEIVNVNLRLVGAGAHDPFTILADADAIAGLLELEVLEQLNAVLVLGIILETALPAAGQPVWERTGGGGTRDGVDGDSPRI